MKALSSSLAQKLTQPHTTTSATNLGRPPPRRLVPVVASTGATVVTHSTAGTNDNQKRETVSTPSVSPPSSKPPPFQPPPLPPPPSQQPAQTLPPQTPLPPLPENTHANPQTTPVQPRVGGSASGTSVDTSNLVTEKLSSIEAFKKARRGQPDNKGALVSNSAPNSTPKKSAKFEDTVSEADDMSMSEVGSEFESDKMSEKRKARQKMLMKQKSQYTEREVKLKVRFFSSAYFLPNLGCRTKSDVSRRICKIGAASNIRTNYCGSRTKRKRNDRNQGIPR